VSLHIAKAHISSNDIEIRHRIANIFTASPTIRRAIQCFKCEFWATIASCRKEQQCVRGQRLSHTLRNSADSFSTPFPSFCTASTGHRWTRRQTSTKRRSWMLWNCAVVATGRASRTPRLRCLSSGDVAAPARTLIGRGLRSTCDPAVWRNWPAACGSCTSWTAGGWCPCCGERWTAPRGPSRCRRGRGRSGCRAAPCEHRPVPVTSSERRGPRTVDAAAAAAVTATTSRADDDGRNDVEVFHRVTDDRVRTRTVTDRPSRGSRSSTKLTQTTTTKTLFYWCIWRQRTATNERTNERVEEKLLAESNPLTHSSKLDWLLREL